MSGVQTTHTGEINAPIQIEDIGDENDSVSDIDGSETMEVESIASSKESDIDQEVSRQILRKLYEKYDFRKGKKLHPILPGNKLSSRCYMYKHSDLYGRVSKSPIADQSTAEETIDWLLTEGYVQQGIDDHIEAISHITFSQNKRKAKLAFEAIKEDAAEGVRMKKEVEDEVLEKAKA